MPDSPAPLCGRRTKICKTCLHHLRCHHGECQHFGGHKDPCGKATGDPCQKFDARPCDSNKLMPNGACRMHGGMNPSGVAHPRYLGKDYSKHLPKRLLADYDAIQEDEKRLTLQREIDLLRLQLGDVLDAMYATDHAIAIEAVYDAAGSLRKAYAQAHTAQRTGNSEKFAEAMAAIGDGVSALGAALSPVMAHDEGRRKVGEMALKLDRLLRTENSVRLAERGMITLESVMARDRALMDAWKDALDETIRDSGLRFAVIGAVARLYAHAVGRRTPAALRAADGASDVILDAEPAASDD